MNISKHTPVDYTVILKCLTYLVLFIIFINNTAVAARNERLAVLPFEMVDNIPAPGSAERNQRMLEKMTNYIAENIDKKGLFKVVPLDEIDNTVKNAQLGTDIRNCNQCEFDLAKSVAGEKVMTGWIYKMSLLILTLHIELKDVATQQTVISKAYDFRGDNEKAWLRAADFMLRDLADMVGR